MKPRPPHLVLFSLVAILMAGCGPKPPVALLPETVPIQELVARLRTRSEFWQGYQARVNVKGESARKNFSVHAVIVANLPDQLRFEANKLGQTVGVLVFNRNRSTLWIPSEQVAYRASKGEDLIEYFLGATIPPEAFSRSLIASLSMDQLRSLQPIPGQSRLLLHSGKSEIDAAYTWKLSPGVESIESAQVRQGARLYSVIYDPPVSLDSEGQPRKISFVSEEWQLEVKIEQLAPAVGSPESAFELPIPGGTRLVDLAAVQ